MFVHVNIDRTSFENLLAVDAKNQLISYDGIIGIEDSNSKSRISKDFAKWCLKQCEGQGRWEKYCAAGALSSSPPPPATCNIHHG